jgi:hypothetical protein
VTIAASRYKDKDAFVLSSGGLSATVIPSAGAAIASLVDRSSGRELLVQRRGEAYRSPSYGGAYADGECSAFDDMFPTIDACHYESHPWTGAQLPDHGEVWSLPWDHAVDGTALRLRVRGVRLPYLLEKRVSIPSDRTLRVDYTLLNDTPYPMDFLWAAHVMAVIEEGSTIIVPRCCTTAMTVLSRSGRMGRYGDATSWPRFTGPDGTHHRADVCRHASVADMEKYYFRDALDEGWCAVRHPDGTLLALSFPVATVPYLGLLLNEHAWDDRTNIFLEPCTATFDRPDVARLRGQASVVGERSTYAWHLCMTVDRLAPGERLVGVTEEGGVVKGRDPVPPR